MIRDKLGETRYRNALADLFAPRTGEDGRPFAAVHAALAQLPFRGFLTTNYDTGLLEARTVFQPRVPVTHFAAWTNTHWVARWLTGEVFQPPSPILFLHGIQNDLDSVVLSLSDYNEAYKQGGQLAHLFNKLWSQEEMVFVGFGFSDPWWAFLANKVLTETEVGRERGPRHVAIIGLQPDEEYTEEYRESFRKRYNAVVLFYQITLRPDGGQDHGDLLEILTHLRPPEGEGPGPGAGVPVRPIDPIPQPPEPYKPHAYRLLDAHRA